MEIDFGTHYGIDGCRMVNYLLEKSRVVIQTEGERNYHIFYMLIAGADENTQSEFALDDPVFFHYLNQSGCEAIEGVDDGKDYEEVNHALNILGFSEEEIYSITCVLAGILHIGNLQFENDDGGEDTSRIDGMSYEALESSSNILGISKDELATGLTEKLVKAGRGSFVTMDLRPDQARDTRDVTAKNLYSKMFDWLIVRINDSLRGKDEDAPHRIGVLDIFGFEVFQLNSFEQLCINYANEKLQFFFNDVIFRMEMEMYAEEGIPHEDIEFQDNSECVFLIEGRPFGILALLEEECSLKGNVTDLSFATKIQQHIGEQGSQHFNEYYFRRPSDPKELFAVFHFAGPVQYDVTGWIEKNRDVMSKSLVHMITSSHVPLIGQLLHEELEALEDTGHHSRKKSKTLGGSFSSQLHSLMADLELTEAHFIRCIKPNDAKKPAMFEPPLCLRQLKYAGLFEAIRIRQSGFAYRIPHMLFARRYALLVPKLLHALDQDEIEGQEAAKKVLVASTSEDGLKDENWAIGHTKVFLKGNYERSILEKMRGIIAKKYVLRIQRIVRGYVQRCKFWRLKFANLEAEEREAFEQEEMYNAATKIQSYFRGTRARAEYASLSDVRALSRAIEDGDTMNIDIYLQHFTPDVLATLTPTHQQSVLKIIEKAEDVGKMLRIQDKLLLDIQDAIEAIEPKELKRLIIRAERLGFGDHPGVDDAKMELGRLNEKKQTLALLISFLECEEGVSIHHNIEQLLDDGEVLGIDTTFLDEVREIFEEIKTKLEIRESLRRSIERVNYKAMQETLIEIDQLKSLYGEIGQFEVRAAKMMIKMLEYEGRLVYKFRNKDEMLRHGQYRRDRLTPTMSEICERISRARSRRDKTKYKKQLYKLNHGDSSEAEMIIRSFKWSKSYCFWRFPLRDCYQIFKNCLTEAERKRDNEEGDFDPFDYGMNVFHRELEQQNSASGGSGGGTSSGLSSFVRYFKQFSEYQPVEVSEEDLMVEGRHSPKSRSSRQHRHSNEMLRGVEEDGGLSGDRGDEFFSYNPHACRKNIYLLVFINNIIIKLMGC